MAKVDVGELKELITNNPEIAPTLALATRMVLNTRTNLGDYVTFLVAGVDEFTPEIVVSKKELRAFAQKVLDEVK